MGGFSLADIGLEWFKDIVGQLIHWFQGQLEVGLRSLNNGLFDTPLPDGSGADVVFGAPGRGDSPWHGIYQSTVGGEVMLLALVVLLIAVQGRHFVRVFWSGAAAGDRRTRRTAWLGGILIVAWYWVGVLTLYVVHGLTIGLMPDVSRLGSALVKLLPTAATNPVLTLAFVGLGGLAVTLLKMLYFLREVLLILFLYGMPIGVALAFGNLPVVSQVAGRFCRQFIPLALLPLPIAVLLRGYEFLFVNRTALVPKDPLFRYTVVISLPVVAVWLTWKTFQYAAPLVGRVLDRTTGTVVTLGTAATAGSVAGPQAAAASLQSGPTAGATEAAVQRAEHATDQEDTPSDRRAGGRMPPYRRTENDPPYR